MATVYDIPKHGVIGTRLDSVKVLDHVRVDGGEVQFFSASSKPAEVSSPAAVQTQDEVMF